MNPFPAAKIPETNSCPFHDIYAEQYAQPKMKDTTSRRATVADRTPFSKICHHGKSFEAARSILRAIVPSVALMLIPSVLSLISEWTTAAHIRRGEPQQ